MMSLIKQAEAAAAKWREEREKAGTPSGPPGNEKSGTPGGNGNSGTPGGNGNSGTPGGNTPHGNTREPIDPKQIPDDMQQ